jgi:ATP-dependent exoDNAse (exonuclease V) alpha subunit
VSLLPLQAVAIAKDGGTVLCSNTAPCQELNKQALRALFPEGLEPIHITTTANQAQHLLDWLKEPGFHMLQQAAVGARVMLTRNMAVSGGVVNGAMGVITGFEHGPPKPYHMNAGLPDSIVKMIKVQLDCGKVVSVRRSVSEGRHEASRSYTKSTFPLAPAYAVTGHKAQGATLTGPVVIHATSTFCPGLLYVMLSRVTTSQQLHFTTKLTPEMFVPMVVPGMP